MRPEPGRGWRLARQGLAAAILAGAAVQLNGLWRFTRTPLSDQVRTLPYTEWFIADGKLDLSSVPPQGVFYNRMSASSHTRGHRYAA